MATIKKPKIRSDDKIAWMKERSRKAGISRASKLHPLQKESISLVGGLTVLCLYGREHFVRMSAIALEKRRPVMDSVIRKMVKGQKEYWRNYWRQKRIQLGVE